MFQLDEARLVARLANCLIQLGCVKGERNAVSCLARPDFDRCICTEFSLLAVEVFKDEIKRQVGQQNTAA